MDNLTHSMAGWALGQAGLKEKSRKGLAALILGANAPDIDVFFGWVPWEPLATHRGVTHSLIAGVIVLPIMLWGLLLALDRWQVSRGRTFKSGLAMRPGWLLALCYIGAITHPLLDLQTTYAVQLFSPVTGLWYHSDSLFIIDVWLWSLFGLTIAWSRMRERQGARDYVRPVRAALVAALGYICLNVGLSDRAANDVLRRDPAATDVFASPDPIRSWQRRMTWRTADELHSARWTIFGGLGRERPPAASDMDDPIVRRAIRQDPRLRDFLNWSIMPIARVKKDGCLARVDIEDGRYGLPDERNQGPLSRATTVDLCA